MGRIPWRPRTRDWCLLNVSSDRVLIDTSFILGLCDQDDEYHEQACKLEPMLDIGTIIVAWPILYETLSTRFVNNREKMFRFQKFLESSQISFLGDEPYREGLLRFLRERNPYHRSMSLVDLVLVQILEDTSVPITAVFTFDFRDFRSVCASYGVILPDVL